MGICSDASKQTRKDNLTEKSTPTARKSSKIILSISQNVETSPEKKKIEKDLILPFATF
jgi:hypothetical protein